MVKLIAACNTSDKRCLEEDLMQTNEPDMIEVRPHEAGFLVLSGGTPIGFITAERTVQTPSGAEYTVREGRGAARLWSGEGRPLVTYDREPTLHIKDETSEVASARRPLI